MNFQPDLTIAWIVLHESLRSRFGMVWTSGIFVDRHLKQQQGADGSNAFVKE